MLERTGYKTNLVALYTLFAREIMRFMRIWSQTLFPPVITMSLYFIIFGKFIGSQIKHIEGYTYIQYIVPGLIMMAMMTNAYANTVASFFLAKVHQSIEEMIVAPMSNLVILLGFTLAGTIRGLLIGIIVLIIALFFTHIPIYHPFIILWMAVLASTVFSLAGLINGVYAKHFDDISFVPTFILTPLTYLGGVFYSIHQLPPIWRTLSIFNPIFAMIDSFRYGFLGISDVNIYLGMSLVIILLIALFSIALYLLHKGVGIKS